MKCYSRTVCLLIHKHNNTCGTGGKIKCTKQYGYTSGSPYQLITIPGINEMLFTNDMSFEITIRVLKNVISLAASAFWCIEVWIKICYNAVCDIYTTWVCKDFNVRIKFWLVYKFRLETEAVFLYCCPDIPRCPANAFQIGQATWAMYAAKKEIQLECHLN